MRDIGVPDGSGRHADPAHEDSETEQQDEVHGLDPSVWQEVDRCEENAADGHGDGETESRRQPVQQEPAEHDLLREGGDPVAGGHRDQQTDRYGVDSSECSDPGEEEDEIDEDRDRERRIDLRGVSRTQSHRAPPP